MGKLPRGVIGSKRIGGVEVKVGVDLSRRMGPADFDVVVRSLSEVVDGSASLSLDDAKDRRTLKNRLLFAIGAVIED